MKILLSPLNSIVGDLDGNSQLIEKEIRSAQKQGVNLLVFPELALQGYPPQDLLLRPGFGERGQAQIERLQKVIAEIGAKDFAAVMGVALPNPQPTGSPLINAAAFISKDKVEVRAKSLIPNYDVFHERRYFASALQLDNELTSPVIFMGKKLGILICEDSWDQFSAHCRKLYDVSPSEKLVKQGAEILINLSASPFVQGKRERRRTLIQGTAKKLSVPHLYVNVFGTNDEIGFDGDAFAYGPNGELLLENETWTGKALTVDIGSAVTTSAKKVDRLADLHQALVVGIRDYMTKNKFKACVLGLSGGIDSAVVAALAVDAVGAANVFGYSLPSKFSSGHSIADADELAKNLGIACENISIKFLQSTVELGLKPHFRNLPPDLTEENLQARLRGLVLMAMSNKFGRLLLTTGNKSELAVGYSTLYGDMCGALAPLGDVFKTDVYALANYLNRERIRIPQNSIDKAPSAELRPNQTDQDSLPDYALLDRMLHFLVEEELNSVDCKRALEKEGKEATLQLIEEIEQRVWSSEFKRNQYAPILKVSERAFGIGRRYPVTKRAFQSFA